MVISVLVGVYTFRSMLLTARARAGTIKRETALRENPPPVDRGIYSLPLPEPVRSRGEYIASVQDSAYLMREYDKLSGISILLSGTLFLSCAIGLRYTRTQK
jgi:hypothetical protein